MVSSFKRCVKGPRHLADALDPVLTAIIEELFEAITTLPNSDVVKSLVVNVAPMLTAAIVTPVTDVTVHVPGEAIQLANSLMRQRGGPLEEEVVFSVTAAVIACLRSTDDMDVIQVSFAADS